MVAAAAQQVYQQPYTPPRVSRRASGTVEPKGSGVVTVQVLVNPDGTFKVTRIVRTTNPADNAAAMDIAQRSSYAPASNHGAPVRGFYDFTITFGGSQVSGAAAEIDALLHRSDWSGARNAAMVALAQNPDDQLVQAQLGVADAFTHDIPGAVTAFDRAGTIPNQYVSIAMQAYSLNAQTIAADDPRTALEQAQKAVTLGGDYSAYYALGTAQRANGNDAAAMNSFVKARSLAASAAPAADSQTKLGIDEAIMLLDIARGDLNGAQQIGNEMNALDPSHRMSQRVMAFYYDQQGVALQKRTDYAGAIAMFERSAQTDPQWAGAPEYTKAAIMYASSPIPDWLKSKGDADKAVAADPGYALADYVAGVALAENAMATGNDGQAQDADIYLRKAIDLAQKAGDDKLAQSAAYFQKNHSLDSNLLFWASQVRVDPARYAAAKAINPGLP